MFTLIRISWRSIWRNRRRTFITMSAIAFALSVTVFFVSFAEGVYAQMIQNAVTQQAGHITLENPRYRDAPAIDLTVDHVHALRAKIDALPGVQRTKLLVQGQGVVKSGAGAVGVVMMGVEPANEAKTSPLARELVAGEYLAPGDLRKIVVGKTLADRLHVGVGKKLVISSNDALGELSEELVRVKGIFSTGAEEVDGYVVQLPIAMTEKFFHLGSDQVTQLGVLVKNPDDRDAVMEKIKALVRGSGVAVLPWEKVMPDLAAYIRIDGGSNIVFQAILIFLSLFTIFNTILMSVLERTREFAVMLALGTPPNRIRLQILCESALIGLLGCAAGLAIGGSIGAYFEIVGFDVSALYGEGVSVSGFALNTRVHADVTLNLLLFLGGAVLTAVILTSVFTMRKVSRISIANVLR